MKKNAYTLIELMISIAILLIVLGTISMVITSHMDVYNAGVKNEETGSKVQTFFSYVIGDLTPVDEEDESNYIEIKKTGDPVSKIEIKRSWYAGTAREEVVYTYSNGEISRGEYSKDDDKGSTGSKILSKGKNFDLEGMDLKVRKSSLEKRKVISGDIAYEEFTSEELGNGVKLALEDDNEKRFNYYIEPIVKLGSGELSRGYGLRFTPEIEGNGEDTDTPFMDVIGMRNGELKFEEDAHTKKSYNGRLPVVVISQNEDATCREMKALDESIECDISGELPEEIRVPYIDFDSYSDRKIEEKKKVTLDPGNYKKLEIEEKAKVTLREGVYRIGELDVKEKVKIIPEGKVKIYTSEVTFDENVKVNKGGDPSQLLIVNRGNNFTLKEDSTFEGFIYSEGGKVLLEEDSKIVGSIVADKEVELKEDSYIEYDRCGAIRFNKRHLENINDIDW